MSPSNPEKPSPGSEAVGVYLRLLREAAGLTMAEIADKIGIDQSQIWRIERGKSDPKSSTMFKFSALVGGELHDIALLIGNTAASREDGEKLAKLRIGRNK